jgi:hypothetical protein
LPRLAARPIFSELEDRPEAFVPENMLTGRDLRRGVVGGLSNVHGRWVWVRVDAFRSSSAAVELWSGVVFRVSRYRFGRELRSPRIFEIREQPDGRVVAVRLP